MTSSNRNLFRVNGHRSPVNSPHRGQWHRALMFCLICAWINGSVNNCEAGDLRRHRAHYDCNVIYLFWWETCASSHFIYLEIMLFIFNNPSPDTVSSLQNGFILMYYKSVSITVKQLYGLWLCIWIYIDISCYVTCMRVVFSYWVATNWAMHDNALLCDTDGGQYMHYAFKWDYKLGAQLLVSDSCVLPHILAHNSGTEDLNLILC